MFHNLWFPEGKFQHWGDIPQIVIVLQPLTNQITVQSNQHYIYNGNHLTISWVLSLHFLVISPICFSILYFTKMNALDANLCEADVHHSIHYNLINHQTFHFCIEINCLQCFVVNEYIRGNTFNRDWNVDTLYQFAAFKCQWPDTLNIFTEINVHQMFTTLDALHSMSLTVDGTLTCLRDSHCRNAHFIMTSRPS